MKIIAGRFRSFSKVLTLNYYCMVPSDGANVVTN